MIFKGKNLRLLYWDHKALGFGNLVEIEHEEYGYDLQVGQKLAQVRYSGVGANREIYIGPEILDINEKGVVLQGLLEKEGVFCPWEKSFDTFSHPREPATGSELCCLVIYPCDMLYEKNPMVDILNGNIPLETHWSYPPRVEKGMWYQHGGWRTASRYEGNLNYFLHLGEKRKTK